MQQGAPKNVLYRGDPVEGAHFISYLPNEHVCTHSSMTFSLIMTQKPIKMEQMKE